MFLKTSKYGLGYVPRFFPFPQIGNNDIFARLIKLSSAFWNFDQPSGKKRTSLPLMTLPNGVSNGLNSDYDEGLTYDGDLVYGEDEIRYIKNVNQVMLSDSIITALDTSTSANFDIIVITKQTDSIDYNNTTVQSGQTYLTGYGYGVYVDDISMIGKLYTKTTTQYGLPVAKGVYTLTTARNLLRDVLLQYQLLTPIDTLNTPFITTVVDMSGEDGFKADITLTNYLGNSTDGYKQIVPVNRRQVTGVISDGTNSYGLIPNNAPNPVGMQDFAFGFILKTGANKVKYWMTRNETSDADVQYAFKMDASGNLFVILEGVSIQIGTEIQEGVHWLWLHRIGGVLTSEIDGIDTYVGNHNIALATRSRTAMFASHISATSLVGYSNDIALLSLYCENNILDARNEFYKIVCKIFGVGCRYDLIDIDDYLLIDINNDELTVL